MIIFTLAVFYLSSVVATFTPCAFTLCHGSPLANSRTKLNNDLWSEPPQNEEEKVEMSQSLPFVTRPKLLDGSLAADAGFDPFGFAGNDKASLLYMREAEIKHCRLAMLAVVGWPLAELLDKPIADSIGLPTLLTKSGASPSVLNGGLDRIELVYWGAVIALAGIVEVESAKVQENKGKNYLPGDCSFDPFGLYPKTVADQKIMQTKEIKNGRLAMMAILGFVVQEALYRVPVTIETPMFFTPIF